MDNNALQAKLFAKLAKVSYTIGKMEQDGKNQAAGWKFVSAENSLGKCRKAFFETGLYLVSEVVEATQDEVGTTKAGTAVFRTTVEMSFHWVDTETGFVFGPLKFIGQDQDQAKSMAQAITDCHKRFVMKALNISSQGDDPEANTVETKTAKSRLKAAYIDSKHAKKAEIVATYKKIHGDDADQWPMEAVDELLTNLSIDPLAAMAAEMKVAEAEKPVTLNRDEIMAKLDPKSRKDLEAQFGPVEEWNEAVLEIAASKCKE